MATQARVERGHAARLALAADALTLAAGDLARGQGLELDPAAFAEALDALAGALRDAAQRGDAAGPTLGGAFKALSESAADAGAFYGADC